MKSIIINNQTHPLYTDFIRLYSTSFPVFEQRTATQHQKAFSNSAYKLVAYKDHETFIGFIAYWEFETYIYIEHYAINQSFRGKGYGSEVLGNFIKETDKIVLLEIDPIVDAISEARLRFYQRAGFFENEFEHVHPPYRSEYPAHSLRVLTTQRFISSDTYKQFSDDLKNIIMQNEVI